MASATSIRPSGASTQFGMGTNEALAGIRIHTKLSTFLTWRRWLWSQRFEWGLFKRDTQLAIEASGENSTLFLLGTATNVRGFDNNYLGPIDEFSLEPLGGESLAFFSQDLTFDTGLFDLGLGLSAFVDGGWVWQSYKDFMSSDPVVTGGFGLVWNSPVGWMRI